MDSSVVKLCRQLRSLAKVFRFVELCILLAFLSWLSTHLPFAVRISDEYFRKLISLIFCPISIFLLENAIVVTLLAKSSLFSDEYSPSIDNVVAELYEEFRSEDPKENPISLKGGYFPR
ncbi:Coronin-1C [Bienertia sinuspersici]